MIKYSIGQVIPEFINHAEMAQFDLRDDGAVLLVFFNRPTEEEIAQFGSGNSFEIRYHLMYNVIMITVKIGELNWMDTPYTPHLSQNLTNISFPAEGQGLGLTLMLIDAISGEIKSMRLLGLSERFSKKILGDVLEEKMKEFETSLYLENVDKIQKAYTTKQLVKMSNNYCKLQ